MTVHPNLHSVPRRERLAPEEFRSTFAVPGRPVVITGSLQWPALHSWSHEWFRDRLGFLEIELSVNPTHTRRTVKMRLDEYVERILSGSRMTGGLYLAQFPLEQLPVLYKDFSLPLYCQPGRKVITHMWFGPGTTLVSFHKDNHHPLALIDNLFVQVYGRKRIIVAGPENDAFMYPRTREAGAYWHSEVRSAAPDFERFPLFRSAQLWEAIVGPGDILFIPRNYWHEVTALERSISLSFWWHPYRLMEISSRVGGLTEAEVESLCREHGLLVSSGDIEEMGGSESLAGAFAAFEDRAVLRDLARNLSLVADEAARECIASALERST